MKLRILAAAAVILPGLCGHALAWGYQGHELVGSIAEHLLGKHAKQQVNEILGYKPLRGGSHGGFTLRDAGPWPDCVKSVKPEAGAFQPEPGSFAYIPDVLEYRIPCTPFENPQEEARMANYVARNWNNCKVNGKPADNCHSMYHYADVSVAHDHYDRTYEGTSDHDIVHAINAAIDVLEGMPTPAPFSIRDKKEALFLLVHFVGDIHQPLHVGAIYLDAQGKPVNPDARGADGTALNTAGGNDLADEQTKLHTEWDAIPLKFGTSASPEMIGAAKAVPPTAGPIGGFAASWASDTIKQAQIAYAGLTFTPDKHFDPKKPKWWVHFKEADAYRDKERALKRAQLAKAGARLAQLLNAIWP